jgi:hypothetical protein
MLHTVAFDPSLLVYQWNSIYPQLTDTYQKQLLVAGKKTTNSVWGTSSTAVNPLLDGGTETSSLD